MFQRFRCCECYKVQNSSLSQQVLSEIVAIFTICEVIIRLKRQYSRSPPCEEEIDNMKENVTCH